MHAPFAVGLLVSALGVGSLLVPAGAAPGIAAGGSVKQGVKTEVIWPVTSCGAWSCCVAGDLKATFYVTVNSDGTAKVQTTLKPMGVGGCGPVGGHVSGTSTVVVGQPASIYGSLSFNGSCQFTGASASALFVVNSNGSVSVQSLVLSITCFDPDPA